ncbi:cathepsin L-like [Drosophila eugracilis]|uniref:cathepsin L-like n=1 Tax=Drosophila eugracilis TaxID=29029 RepID=UPI0007E87F5B|nr:cathepsin L-like [Drosophila eugracilis]
MKLILILVLLTPLTMSHPVALDQNSLKDWQDFKLQHAKSYQDSNEEFLRRKIFHEIKININQHNLRFAKGMETFKLAINQFSDMYNTEINFMMNAFDLAKSRNNGSTFISPEYSTLPKFVDWRSKGAVTQVRHQGFECGSCWAHVTAGALEGQHFRKTGKLISLSPQHLLDCSNSYGNHGCLGGSMAESIDYIKDNGGIATEQSYPYRGLQGECNMERAMIGATSSGYVHIPQGDEKKLAEAVAFFGPVIAAIDSSHPSFKLYSRGVYEEPACNATALNHAVLVVGFGTTKNGKEYWLVKNSWGKKWGINGYIKMLRNANNHCGIASVAIYPLV